LLVKVSDVADPLELNINLAAYTFQEPPT